ncbi:DNA polymerase III subunit delta [Aquibium sp. A9E412]|uniref:DNA polymerase III subunit delta n=1 Tax=Aquibium sp. A9E412 TaxID=2976767 RepID=UPI0025AF82B9|nr:DNA polymerase III subunit delta [Aquibium sp. A9E412]MDN2567398.1 DNA polymerase III subunit delta [Aquibium sp. A9E412]
MAQKKSHEVDGWLRRPDPRVAVVLIYGPDRGLVAERARQFAERSGADLDDPFSVVRLEAGEVEQQPGRLLDEARAVPMFSERRLIWLRGAGTQKALAAEIAELCAAPPADARLLVEAGELRKGAALRSAVEKADAAMALPCYADDGRGLDALIDGELAAAGLGIGLEARQLLKANLGGDRLATRGELEKLTLYCRGRTTIEADDVRALGGDVSALDIDETVDAVLTGDTAAFDRSFARLLAAGTAPFLFLAAAQRRLHALQAMRHAMDAEGKTPAAAVAAARPPVFFARRPAAEKALRAWPAAGLAHAAERLQAGILKTRQRPDLAAAIARQTLMALSLTARRGR